ncbi:MAG: filamentous hemagglutinin N-terminal domain-containing protein [Desulfococcaceae bacterium]
MKHCFRQLLAMFLGITVLSFPLHADVIMDGSMGTAGALQGPAYEISAEYGRQAGSNLFHSFQTFDIHTGESATFSGPSSVERIISRITGGNLSHIDGLLRSAIPNADMFLLNPAGFIFGPNASLDIGGSFHVSTADYLRMGDSEKFFSQPVENEILSVAPPAAFGFLNAGSGSIVFEGGEVTEADENGQFSGMTVNDGKTISVIGGDIAFQTGLYYETSMYDEEGNPLYQSVTDENGDPMYDDSGSPVYETDGEGNLIPLTETLYPASLSAPGGQIFLASAASAGEIGMRESGADISCEQFGNISISDWAWLDVSGDSGGAFVIRAGQFFVNGGRLYAETESGAGKGMDIQADSLLISDGGLLSTDSYGAGDGGNISIKVAKDAVMTAENYSDLGIVISANANGTEADAGNGGSIEIQAENIEISSGAILAADSYGSGKGGNVKLEASDTVKIAGENEVYISAVFATAAGKESGAGQSGNIDISAANLEMSGGAAVGAMTSGPGNGGNISVQVKNAIRLSGESSQGIVTSIAAGTRGEMADAGQGGNITLSAQNLILSDGAQISSSTSFGPGQGGSIFADVADTITLSGAGTEFISGIFSNAQGEEDSAGNGGLIEINTKNLKIDGGAQIGATSFGPGHGGTIAVNVSDTAVLEGFAGEDPETGFSSGLTSNAQGESGSAGNGGSIFLQAGQIIMKDNSVIAAKSNGAGQGGNVAVISSGDMFMMGNSQILTGSFGDGDAGNIEMNVLGKMQMADSSVTTATTKADGGNIALSTPVYLRMNSSDITTSVEAENGDGGNINLDTKFIVMDYSRIIARAVGGDGGNIDIFTTGIFRFAPESESPIDASSQLGVDGIVTVNSPETDISGSLLVLPSSFSDPTQWMSTPCAARSGADVSRFVFLGQDAVPSPLDDWLYSPIK